MIDPQRIAVCALIAATAATATAASEPGREIEEVMVTASRVEKPLSTAEDQRWTAGCPSRLERDTSLRA